MKSQILLSYNSFGKLNKYYENSIALHAMRERDQQQISLTHLQIWNINHSELSFFFLKQT